MRTGVSVWVRPQVVLLVATCSGGSGGDWKFGDSRLRDDPVVVLPGPIPVNNMLMLPGLNVC